MNFSLIGIFVGLILLMILAFRGHSIIWVAPFCAVIVALFGGYSLLDSYIVDYMTGTANYVQQWFPAFFLGAVYGKIMDKTGAARSLANKLVSILGSRFAILSIVIPCLLMTYGGISLFVVVFVIYPMGLEIYREANIPRQLLPGAIATGAFGISMTALPGTPQIQNLIPTEYYGTTAMAAPFFSIVASLVMFIPAYLYLEKRAKEEREKGNGFVADARQKMEAYDPSKLPSWHWVSGILPLIIVVFMLNGFPRILEDQAGILLKSSQTIVIALLCGIFVCSIMNIGQKEKIFPAINEGANGSIGAIMNTACAVGFGAVVKMMPGFQTLTQVLMNVPGSVLFSEAIAVNLLAGSTGSASGGMSIALEALAPKYMEMAAVQGIGVGALHRIASISSGGLDTLPHNGAVLTLLNVSNCTHKEAYKDIAITTAIIPVIASVLLAFVWGALKLPA